MKKFFTKLTNLCMASSVLLGGFVVADEVPSTIPVEKELNEEISDKNAIKSRKKGGRVIEYGGEMESNNGVVPAVVQADPLKKNADKKSDEKKQNINQKNSVKLITGGDPSDGNAKSGHLPVLD